MLPSEKSYFFEKSQNENQQMSGEVTADDPAQLSKRRKHLENMKGQQTTQKSKSMLNVKFS